MESDFELEGKGVDAAALAEEVARRVRERRDSGVYSDVVESLLAERLPEEEESGGLPPAAELDYSATSALSAWEVTTAYPVETEKRFLRPLVILAKRLARKWAGIAVGPIQREQSSVQPTRGVRAFGITPRSPHREGEDPRRGGGSLPPDRGSHRRRGK